MWDAQSCAAPAMEESGGSATVRSCPFGVASLPQISKERRPSALSRPEETAPDPGEAVALRPGGCAVAASRAESCSQVSSAEDGEGAEETCIAGSKEGSGVIIRSRPAVEN